MILIADDFGLGRDHDRVILKLLSNQKLHGTSVLVNDNIDDNDIKKLKNARLEHNIQIGLHLNLTQELPAIPRVWSLGFLLWRSILGTLPCADIEKSIQLQIAMFKDFFDMEPDFIDGHQHCHIFPTISSIVAKQPHVDHTWMRIPAPNNFDGIFTNLRSGGLKVLLIVSLALFAKPRFKKRLWKFNHDFSGFMMLNYPPMVAKWLPILLSKASSDCLVMVHPGDCNDPMQCLEHAPQSREIETRILS